MGGSKREMRARENNTDVGRFGWTSRTGEGSGQPQRTEDNLGSAPLRFVTRLG